MLNTKPIARVLLVLVLLAGIPLAVASAMAADAPCAEAAASGDVCCGDAAGVNTACALDCAAGCAALPLVAPSALPVPQRGDSLTIQSFASASHSGPPETAPPKAS